MKFKPTILIDLDGVLNHYLGDYDPKYIPKINKNAIEFLKKLHVQNKYELVLFSSRNLLLAAKWLIKNNIDCYFSDITNVKKTSSILIDDRAICFDGDFNKLLKEIQNFKVWYK